jgi:hypothetical protein
LAQDWAKHRAFGKVACWQALKPKHHEDHPSVLAANRLEDDDETPRVFSQC